MQPRKSPDDIKAQYASASFLAGDRVVFNIKGNKYRIIVAVRYQFSVVYIRFIGTHAEYDEIDAVSRSRASISERPAS